ncbi:MAG TPA: aldose epimerase family protein [Terriglobales bacterium]|nr:aldose epimerase family protein [Terriglobales bacterium]
MQRIAFCAQLLLLPVALYVSMTFAQHQPKFERAAANNRIHKEAFGKTEDGREADLYVLRNKNGMEVAITNYGADIVRLKVPDRHGKVEDVVLGYDNLDGYIHDKAYFGATVGRYANRIAHGQFTLDGHVYTLPKNNGDNTLHGGTRGFNKALWTAKDVSVPAATSLQMSYLSKDGDQGFPGNLSVDVRFALNDDNSLKIEYAATSDKDTVLNLTNHSYFNLAGQGNGNILKQELTLHASRFTPVNANLIPTSQIVGVKGTPLDFTQAAAIGARIGANFEQLKLARGYDHNFVLDGNPARKPVLAARAYDPGSGRVLEVWTSQPGIQFYSGNFLDGTVAGKGGVKYPFRSGFCLETQHFPDSPNQPKFPSTELKAGRWFRSTTTYKFSTQ